MLVKSPRAPKEIEHVSCTTCIWRIFHPETFWPSFAFFQLMVSLGCTSTIHLSHNVYPDQTGLNINQIWGQIFSHHLFTDNTDYTYIGTKGSLNSVTLSTARFLNTKQITFSVDSHHRKLTQTHGINPKQTIAQVILYFKLSHFHTKFMPLFVQ